MEQLDCPAPGGLRWGPALLPLIPCSFSAHLCLSGSAPELPLALQAPRACPPQQTGSRVITHRVSLWGGSQGHCGAPRELGPQGALLAQHLDRDTLKASGQLRSMFLEHFIL